ncbi:MAG: alpha/beta fold hydrolase [Spirochaetota bacterium]
MKDTYFKTTCGLLHYRYKEGDGNVKVVCIHGAGGDSRLYIPLMNELRGFTIYAVDLPGHGKTASEEYSLHIYVDALSQFLQSINGNILVCGHSMGGGLIFELVRKKVPLAAAVFIATAAKLPVNQAVFELLQNDFDSFCRLAVDLSYGNLNEAMRTQAIQYMKDAGSKLLYSDFEICNAYNYEEYAKECSIAALFIANRKDKMVPLDIMYSTYKAMPNAMLHVLPYRGHMLHIEQVKLVAHSIEYFISSLHH